MHTAGRSQRNPRCGTQRTNGTLLGSIIGLAAAVVYLGMSMSNKNNNPEVALAFPAIIGIGAAIGKAFDDTRYYCIDHQNQRADTEAQSSTTTFLNRNTNDPCELNEEDPQPPI